MHYLHRDGQSVPVEADHLRRMARDGDLRPEDQVYLGDRQAWVQASQVDFLADAWPAAAPPPPPPPPPPPRASHVAAPPAAAPPPALRPAHAGAAHAAPRSSEAASIDAVVDVLQRAFDLYKRHFVALLLTCAVLLVPAAFVKATLSSLLLWPAQAAMTVAGANLESSAREASERARKLQEEMVRTKGDPERTRQLAEEYRQAMEGVGRDAMAATGTAVGGFVAVLLGALATFLTTLVIQGVAVPLTRGALTVAVADLQSGGDGDWKRAWSTLLRRLVPLLLAVVPAGLLVAVGTLLFILPGLVAGFLFSFVAPVALVEGKTGLQALERSVKLVLSDWLRVLLVFIVLAGLTFVVSLIVGVVFSGFFGSLLTELALIAVLPFPITATVLLYFDLRQRQDGVDVGTIRRELDAA